MASSSPGKTVELTALTSYLRDLTPKWMNIGVKLDQEACVRALSPLEDMTPEDKCLVVLKKWVDSGKDVSWARICSVLCSKGVDLEEVAKQMQQAHAPQAKPAKVASVDTTAAGDTSTAEQPEHSNATTTVDSPYQKLRRRLKRLSENEDNDMWTTEEERNVKTKKAVTEFFDACQLRGLEQKEVAVQIETLYEKEHYIPPIVYSWATEYLEEMENIQESSPTANDESAKVAAPTPKEPLFSQDNVYHALLCCKALESPDEQKVVAVLGEHGHLFDHLSVTKKECQKKHGGDCSHGTYLIAQKGDTYIVAFRGLPAIVEWKKMGTFQDAIAKLSSFVPANYFAQLVKDSGRVVFTGYSLGGTLACAVLTNMLKSNPLQQQLLEENVACITFGQPPLVETDLENLLTQQKFLSKCFHFIHLDECVKPILLKYCLIDLNSQKTKSEGSLPVAGVSSDLVDAVKELLQVQAAASKGDDSDKKPAQLPKEVQQVREKVGLMNEKRIVKEGEPPLPQGNYYQIRMYEHTAVEGTTEESSLVVKSPVKWEMLSRERVITLFSQLDPSCISMNSSGMHHLATYYELLPVFLETVPGSSFVTPEVRQKDLPCIEGISPELASIDLHCYEHEVVILVSGKDLWFARDLKVSETKALQLFPSAQENAERQIQAWSDRKKAGKFLQDQESNRKVTLGSCLEAGNARAQLRLRVKSFGISARQAQLAKLPDLELISTALLSAAMERRSYSTDDKGGKALYSRKFTQICNFLKQALDVVPIEGLFHCLAESAQELGLFFTHTASIFLHELFQAVDTFCSRSDNIPPSVIMLHCLTKLLYGGPMSDYFNTWSKTDIKSYTRVHGILMRARERIKHHLRKSRGRPILSDVRIKGILCSTQWADPHDFLISTMEELDKIASVDLSDTVSPDAHAVGTNEKLLEVVKGIKLFAFCLGNILTSFMGAQVQIPLSRSSEYTARALENTEVAVGVWYLIGLSFVDFERIEDKQLVIDVANYIGKVLGKEESAMKGLTNAGKAQFICQAMSNSVSCSAEYVSYSLERQLNELCLECKITVSTPVEEICQKWEEFFKERILSLIPRPYRSLVARWIHWMLAIYELREALASYTTIAAIGLLNSGKSTLVNSLFGRKVPSGTLESKRTTVPFLYSLEPDVSGIDVMDFPGVDDCNPHIQSLCHILFQVSHIFIFIVDYRKAHSVAAMHWISMILQTEMPLLICLTFGDKLFAEIMPGYRQHPEVEVASAVIQEQLRSFKEKCVQYLPSVNAEQFERRVGTQEDLKIIFCAFNLDKDSTLHEKEGRDRLMTAGIQSAKDVGDWIIELLRNQQQSEAAESLRSFFDKHASG